MTSMQGAWTKKGGQFSNGTSFDYETKYHPSLVTAHKILVGMSGHNTPERTASARRYHFGCDSDPETETKPRRCTTAED